MGECSREQGRDSAGLGEGGARETREAPTTSCAPARGETSYWTPPRRECRHRLLSVSMRTRKGGAEDC